jgi:hypothetical protein
VVATIIAFGTQGEAVGGSAIQLVCSDLYGNAGGNWVGAIAPQSGWNGNFSLDPRFSDLPSGDYHIWNHSPCNLVVCAPVGAWPVGCSAPLGIDPAEPADAASQDPSVTLSSPNPFTDRTAIRFSVPAIAERRRVQVRIFDPAGRLVRTLIDAPYAPGSYGVAWDGRTDAGESASSGVYFCRVRIGEWEATRTILRVK